MQNLFERARSFVYRNARPLDFARWKFHFEGGSAEEVLRVLAAYQNPDGGFGHGLEADALNPNSSPTQTWCATTILREVGVLNPCHPIVSGIVRYLTSGASFDGHCWANAIPTNNDYPHAPWWHFGGPSEGVNYNPTASLAGFLIRVGEPETPAWNLGMCIAREAVDFYLSDQAGIEMHLIACYLTLIQDLAAVQPDFPRLAELTDKLRQDVRTCVLQDADRWADSYCSHPSSFIAGCEDPFYACFPEVAQRECAFIEEMQEPSGAWPIPWSWGDYPDAFAVSANHWRSTVILEKLLYLKGMNRL